MTEPIDYGNPCAVLPIVREAYYKLLAGGAAQTIEFTTAGGTKRVLTFQKTSLDALGAELRRLEGLCPGTPTGVPRRRAILAGNGGGCW